MTTADPSVRPSRAAAVAFLLGLPTFAAVRAWTRAAGFGDADRYLAVAREIGRFVGPPFGYRIGVPYTAAGLAGATGLDLPTSFLVLQVAAFSTVLAVLAWWVTREGFVPTTTAALVVLFVATYAGTYHVHNVVHVGFVESLLYLLGAVAVHRRHVGLLAAVLVAAAVSKENVAWVALAWMAVGVARGEGRQAVLRGALALAGFVATLLAVRHWIGTWPRADAFRDYASHLSWTVWRDVRAYQAVFENPVRNVVATFHLLWLTAAAGLVAAPRAVRVLVLAWVPLAIGQALLATDVARMTAAAFPVLLLAAAHVFQALSPGRVATLVALHVAVYAAWMTRWHFLPVLVVAVVVTAALLIAWYPRGATAGRGVAAE